ncbi:hypothetical protein HYY75_06970, partial [bacterium]|nr:hypothetical protein [bacterium]
RVIERAVTIAKAEDNQKAQKLESFFHSGQDKEIRDRTKIKNFVSTLGEEAKKKLVDYLKDPSKNEKPINVKQYLGHDRGKKTKQSPKILRVNGIISKLITEIAPRFKDIAGGYTRIFRLGNRRGDSAELALIEFSR